MEDAVDGGGGGSPLPAESGERTDDKPHVPSRPVPARPAPPPPGVARQSPIIPRSQPSTAAVRTEQMSAPAKPSEPPAKPSGTPAKPSGTPAKPSGTPAKPSGTPAKPSGPPAKPSGTPAQVTTKKQDLFEQSSHKSAGKTKSQSSVKKYVLKLVITNLLNTDVISIRKLSLCYQIENSASALGVLPQPTLTAGKPAIPVTQANHHSVKPALAHLHEPQPPPKPARSADSIRKPQEEKPSEGVAQVDKPVHPIKPTRVSIIRPAPRQKLPPAEVESSISEASPNIIGKCQVPPAFLKMIERNLWKELRFSISRSTSAPASTTTQPANSVQSQDQISLSEEVIEGGGVIPLSSPPAVPSIRPQGATNSVKHKVTSERLDGPIFSQADDLNASVTSAASRTHPTPVPISRPQAPPTAVTASCKNV
ncbi:hypothetical protein C0Q70_06327 [Pomacea canaliculata]|uniref:Uncharacterized protein n=1 Tax=Pomacea canaliculata TaxID=400727 RepID=A0A2T7PNN7_POMCA|nr:hypothetical protein C0Q70_06327 [Pomacea canaliculata]